MVNRPLAAAAFALVAGTAQAQTPPSPAEMGMSSTVPEVLQVLDSTQTWAPIGTVDPAVHGFNNLKLLGSGATASKTLRVNGGVFQLMSDAYASGGGSALFTADDAGDVYAAGSTKPSVGYSAAVLPIPACSAALKGAFADVLDAMSPIYNSAYVSGGATVVPVWCDGATWRTLLTSDQFANLEAGVYPTHAALIAAAMGLTWFPAPPTRSSTTGACSNEMRQHRLEV